MNIALKLILFIFFSNIFINCQDDNVEYCSKENCKSSNDQKVRYLFYDINPSEGFNLRRDVYVRFAVFAHNLQKSSNPNLNNFKLVLPPWTRLYHWRKDGHRQIFWSRFFNLPSLQSFAPVIEMHQFFDEINIKYSTIKIDEVYILQHFEDMFRTGKFEDKMKVEKCNKGIETSFFRYDNITSNNIKCLSFHGHTKQLSKLLENTNKRTILFDHAEIALHDQFGNKVYWKARRSMRFNKELREIATRFRQRYLNSTDDLDNTVLPEKWTDEKHHRNAKGGPYLSVHLRRRDFARVRSKDVPDLEDAASQIDMLLRKLNLMTVFIATDAPEQEYNVLYRLLTPNFKVFKYVPEQEIKDLHEGQLAIIDQIICSHARYFVGTYESTFSFRIQEEREILGFPIENTFNRLCGNNDKCKKPSVWKIVY